MNPTAHVLYRLIPHRLPLAGPTALASLALLAGCAQPPKPAPVDPHAKPDIQASQGQVRMPSGVDLKRLKLLDKGQMPKVYLEMLKIDEGPNVKLFFPPQMAERLGTTPLQLTRIFTDTLLQSRRFQVYDLRSNVVASQTDVVLNAMVTGAFQSRNPNIVPGQQVVQTRVDLSVQMKRLYGDNEGEMVGATSFNAQGITGLVNNERTVLSVRADARDPEVQQQFAQDYDRALRRAFRASAKRVESVMRPLGRVASVSGTRIAMLGGLRHGFQPDDEIVVFRATITKVGETEVERADAIAALRCDSVGDSASQCEVIRQNPQMQMKAGDYAVLSDLSLKQDRWE